MQRLTYLAVGITLALIGWNASNLYLWGFGLGIVATITMQTISPWKD